MSNLIQARDLVEARLVKLEHVKPRVHVDEVNASKLAVHKVGRFLIWISTNHCQIYQGVPCGPEQITLNFIIVFRYLKGLKSDYMKIANLN